jgi:hypothetical protein
MTFNITETIETVAWSEGTNNAPADLVTKAREMVELGEPTTFGKLASNPNAWVVLGVNKANNQLYVAHRANS